MLVARENKTVLYSDDLRLRQYAQAEWQVRGIWTQSVLRQMLQKQLLTEDEYCDAVTKLFWLNYRHVSINAHDLMWALKQDGMEITPRVMRLFTVLQGPDCSEESAALVVADLIRSVWLESAIVSTRQFVLELALDSLTTRHPASSALLKLKQALQPRFALIPQAIPEIYQTIDLFRRQRLSFRLRP